MLPIGKIEAILTLIMKYSIVRGTLMVYLAKVAFGIQEKLFLCIQINPGTGRKF